MNIRLSLLATCLALGACALQLPQGPTLATHADLTPPAVNDAQGIGVGPIGVLAIGTEDQFAKRDSFKGLDGEEHDAPAIDVERLEKFNGDSDRYAYWLATHFSFADLVAGFKASPTPTIAAATPASAGAAVPGVVAAYGLCETGVSVRSRPDIPASTKRWICDGSERRYRERLAQGGLGMDAAEKLAWPLLHIDASKTGGLIPRPFDFLHLKLRVGIAWAVVGQAAHVAKTGQLDQQASSDVGFVVSLAGARAVREKVCQKVNGALLSTLQHVLGPQSTLIGDQPAFSVQYPVDGDEALAIVKTAAPATYEMLRQRATSDVGACGGV
ncbi:hypothetical protein PQR68_34470 [Paraburkholderia agricolaris]|uniref:hypothetical protein n=1 Tax=Paraburkholderia agricolaris TaxID=2152888 RepID=UPI0038BD07D7